jgi:uncharacterized membrane protein YdjX (TVP38/TMEM64 family)
MLLVLLTWLENAGELGLLLLVAAVMVVCFPFAVGYTPLALAAGFLYGLLRGATLFHGVIGCPSLLL